MKAFFLLSFMILVSILCGCSETSMESRSTTGTTIGPKIALSQPDSADARVFFDSLMNDRTFKRNELFADEQAYMERSDLPIILGDMNQDGLADALIPFAVVGRGGGNNWTSHYVVLLGTAAGKFRYAFTYNAGGDMAPETIVFKEITPEYIVGYLRSNLYSDREPTPVRFVFRDGDFIPVAIAPHQVAPAEPEYLELFNLLTPEDVQVPLTGTWEDYKRLLGTRPLETPEDQQECGTYFDEGTLHYVHYPAVTLEVNDSDKAAVLDIDLRINGWRLQTDKGTISHETTFKELRQAFYQPDKFWIERDPDDDRYWELILLTGEDSDSYWRLRFDKKDQLIQVVLWIQC